MGWETRGNNQYYYRKKRVGDRVLSEYVGKGILAEYAHKLDMALRKERLEKLKNEKDKLKDIEKIEEEIKMREKHIQKLVEAAFLISGLHTHKREWRRLRKWQKKNQKKKQ